MSNRARWSDIEQVPPSAWGAGGGYRIFCPGGCDFARARGGAPVWGHRYIFHTKTSALAEWRREHPKNGEQE